MDTYRNHSEEVQDIVGKMPPWILANGMMIFTVLIVAVIAGAWFIKYPDIVSAPVLISSTAPPIKMIAQSQGRLSKIYVRDGDTVKKGQMIAAIDNAANIDDILALKKMVESFDTTLNLDSTVMAAPLIKTLQVGGLQSDYAFLIQAISTYRFFVANPYYGTKVARLNSQKQEGKNIEKTILEERKLLSKQVEIEKWKDSINKKLLDEKVISRPSITKSGKIIYLKNWLLIIILIRYFKINN
ncbi:MAG: biotin/lipoyl-binding protein [Agriterribacter sp.]